MLQEVTQEQSPTEGAVVSESDSSQEVEEEKEEEEEEEEEIFEYDYEAMKSTSEVMNTTFTNMLELQYPLRVPIIIPNPRN